MNPNPYTPPGADVADVPAAPPRPAAPLHWSIKALAILLVAGGVLGMGIAIWLAIKAMGEAWTYLIPCAGLLLLFFWTSLTGIRLWRNEARGWKWARWLFAAQIPLVTLPGFTYRYFSGFHFSVIVGDTPQNVAFGLGANANIFFGPAIKSWMFGVNLFAVFALVVLIRASQRKAPEPSATLA